MAKMIKVTQRSKVQVKHDAMKAKELTHAALQSHGALLAHLNHALESVLE